MVWSRTLLLVVVLLVAVSVGAVGEVTPEGDEFQANAHTTSAQGGASVASVGDGGFVIVWTSYGQDGSGYGIFGQRFGEDGTPAGSEFQVNNFSTGDQTEPAVAAADAGGFVVVWQGEPGGVRARRFSSQGQPLESEFQVNASTTGPDTYPDIAASSDGSFLVVWERFGDGGILLGDLDIIGRRLDSSGLAAGSEFRINTTTPHAQFNPAVDTGPGGAFTVVWESYGSSFVAASLDVFGRRFAGDGSALGNDFVVSSSTTGSQRYPDVAVGEDGAFLVVWEDNDGHDGDGLAVLGRRFNGSGQAEGDQFQVNTYATGNQYMPAAAVLDDGRFVVAWTSTGAGSSGQDGADSGIFGQLFENQGGRSGMEFQINSYTTGAQYLPALATGGDGRFAVVWDSNGTTEEGQDGDSVGVFGRRLRATGGPAASACADPVLAVASSPLGGTAVVTASDALLVLRAATALTACELCVCDVDGSGTISATDALATLKLAVGHTVALSCPPCA